MVIAVGLDDLGYRRVDGIGSSSGGLKSQKRDKIFWGWMCKEEDCCWYSVNKFGGRRRIIDPFFRL